MNPATADLTGDNQIYRGDTWQYGGVPLGAFTGGVLHMRDTAGSLVNLTTFSLKAQIRTAPAPGGGTPVDIVCTKMNQGTDPGGFTLTLTATTTAGMSQTTSSIWDLQVTDGSGNVFTILRGSVTVTLDISQ